MNEDNLNQNKKIYTKTWFIILMFFIFWPVGLFLMFKYANWNKFIKGTIVLLILVAIITSFVLPKSEVPTSSTPRSKTTTTQKDSKVSQEELRKEANASVISTLGTFYKKTDEVEKYEWYMPYPDLIPARTAVYWYVGLNSGDQINQRVKFVHFSDNMGWVFWDNVIFSTSEKNWKFEVGSFAGQSGNGKSTQIVYGGKYEYLDVPFDKLKKGFEILTTGTNPIIRLEGQQFKYDIRLTPEDIASLKNALEFERKAQLIGNKITRGQ